VERQVWRRADGSSEDPFARRSGLSARSFSLRLQRAALSFGLDFPYEQCAEQLAEHYGLDISKSSIRSIVNRHCAAIAGEAEESVGTLPSQGEDCVVVEADGSMLPIAAFEEGPDRRRTKTVQWREFKLCAARSAGSSSTCYGGSFCGAEEFAPKWERCALGAGWGAQSRIHGVGDGAEWLEKTFQGSFGAQGSYLLDFFHLSEYLAEAGKAVDADDGWLKRQQKLLKESKALKAFSPNSTCFDLPKTAKRAPSKTQCATCATARSNSTTARRSSRNCQSVQA
jgi:hypothetical protein